MGGLSHPGVELVTMFPVDDVRPSSWVTSPSGVNVLTHRLLWSIRECGVVISPFPGPLLTGHAPPFPETSCCRVEEWAPPGRSGDLPMRVG